jgi:hypothetical protein
MPVVPAVTTSVLATISVSLWTLRVALTARNRKVLAAAAASVEATVFALAFSRLLANLNSSSQVVSYAVGVGVGTLVGLAVNETLADGRSGDGLRRRSPHADGEPGVAGARQIPQRRQELCGSTTALTSGGC